MAANKKKQAGMSDERLVKVLHGYQQDGVGFYDSDLKLERREVADYHDMLLPKKNSLGKSTYVSQDVYDAVWAMHAQILETFCGNRRVVKFSGQGADDVRLADIQTEYCAHVFFNQNHGYRVCNSVTYDGLTSRVGIAKAWWEPKVEIEDKKWPDRISYEEAEALDASLGPEVVDVTLVGPDAEGLHDMTISVEEDVGQVRVEAVPPEDFIVAKKARCLSTVDFLAHRQRKTQAELLEDGYTQKQLDEIGSDHWLEDTETVERFWDVDGGEEHTHEGDPDLEGKVVWLFENYIRANLDGTRKRLWKVLTAGNSVLGKERIKRHPFVAFVPLAVPHKFWGVNYAARNFHTQNSKTALSRSIIDYSLVTANPRYTVLNGGVANPAEIKDNRLGGIINLLKPDAVRPLEQPILNPLIFQTLGQLDQDAEDTNGISRLSQGLSKDAISKQNSADLVEQLTTNSQTRQKIIARNFAEFLIDLYVLISDLVIENEKQERVVEVAGDYVAVDISKWRRREDMIVDVSLGYGDNEREAGKWMMMHQLLLADPDFKGQYGPEQKFRTVKKILELRGVKDVENHVLPAEKAQPPQPDPLMMAELQLKQAEAETKKQKLTLDAQESERKTQVELEKLALEKLKIEGDQQIALLKLELEKQKAALDAEIALAELKVVQEKAATEQLTAIASPNS